ncbi:MAG: DUF1810 domain-containing protein [Bacteroidales bacterium]|nr:DUF1810 domain-containing protein [Bacteroidales bacterium]
MEAKYYLQRYLNAQDSTDGLVTYDRALAEIRAGGKSSHWVWYIFPQIKGIPGGHSRFTLLYGITNKEEAIAYWAHPVLGPRLREITEALLAHKGKRSALQLMGSNIDALKLRSCMTLFWCATREPLFKQVIDDFFFGTFDHITIDILNRQAKQQ